MALKREMLEERTVKELREMARDNGISGYSTKRKSELIDLIGEELTEDEVRSWSGTDSGREGPSFSLIKIGVAILVVAALVGFTLGYLGIGPAGSSRKKYVNENFGFSVTYPSSWVSAVEDFSGTEYENSRLEMYITKNDSGNGTQAMYLVTVEDSSGETLENIRDREVSKVESGENVSLISDSSSESVDGEPAFEISVRRVAQSGKIYRTDGLFAREDNFLYILMGVALENNYEDYSSSFNQIIESFTFLD